MSIYYLIFVVILVLLAISDLIVGVANDAVNFLNSSIGSRVAKRHWILLVASAGVLIGSFFSGGMMEVARKGVFHPEMFYMSEIMVIFLAVMITDVLVLDFFNTFGMPTSTTVSLVFELLGAAVAVSIFKMMNNGETLANIGNYINSGKALAIISGILISVVIAFAVGALVMYITRFLFTFNYNRSIKYIGSVWGGIALTAITYFIVMKGISSSSLISNDVLTFIGQNTLPILLYSFVAWTIIFQICISVFKLNILRFVVLAGTFALALSFAGNDLVNFIGVSLAGIEAFNIHLANPGISPDSLLMEQLAQPVSTNHLFLAISGAIMVVTLWFSKKSRSVTETEVGLARQGDGAERFGSTLFSRSVVRVMRNFNTSLNSAVPSCMKRFVDSRFDLTKAPSYPAAADAPAFDLIRASVNLTVASILISMATSLKLPLSTTYVTFMVAMGTSLSDRAWGRESAVYRITGVLSVIGGWFFTAFIAFTLALIVAAALFYGKTVGLIILVALVIALLIKSQLMHRKKSLESSIDNEVADNQSVVNRCTTGVNNTLKSVIKTYTLTIEGLTTENRKLLKSVNQDVENLNAEAKKLKYNVYKVLKELEADSIETGHYYVQVIDYLREIAHSLSFVSNPSLQHIDNQHKGLSEVQTQELNGLSVHIKIFFDSIMNMIKNHDYTAIPEAIAMQQQILDEINKTRKKQVKRIKQGESGTRNSVLYLGILNEVKNIMLQTMNLLKAQRDFILNNVD